MMLLLRPFNFPSLRRLFIPMSTKNVRFKETGAAALPGIRDLAATHTPTLCHSSQSAAEPTCTIGAWDGRIEQWQLVRNKTMTMFALHHPSPASQWQRNFSSLRGGAPNMRDCRTLEEALDENYDYMEFLTPRNIAAFWGAVPRLLKNWNDKSSRKGDEQKMFHQLNEISTLTMEEIDTFGYRDLATVALGFAKIMDIVGNPEVRFREGGPHRILRDLLIGQNSEIKEWIFKKIAGAAVFSLPEFEARSLSNLIYAYGLAKHIPKFEDGRALFDILALEAIQKLATFTSQGLSNMLWAYATLGASNPRLFEEAGDNICVHQNLSDFRPQGFSNIVWSFATAKESHPRLFKKVADHIIALDNLSQFEPQHLSNITWAYATAKEAHPRLFKKVANNIIALDNLNQFKPQHLSNTVWAYATAKESPPRLFKRVADHIIALDNLRQFKPQELSNIVWAYADSKESHPQLFKKVADHITALNNLNQFKPQEFSNTVWAYATAKESHPRLFKEVADHIIGLDNLSHFEPQHLSNTVWAFATAEESHPKLFKILVDFAIRKRNEFNSQAIANFLWAFASNGLVDQHLFTSFAPKAAANLSERNSQNLANIGWAYAVADVDAPSLFNDDFINACIEKEHKFITENLSQLHQWQLWQDELNSNIGLPPSLREKCYKAFLTTVPAPSALQNDVFAELSPIGLKPEEEVLTNSGYRLDAVVEVNGKKIGIEVDGPTHFIKRKPKGNTILKHRQVTNLEGIPVVSVPYWEWNKLRKDSGKKQQYLRSLLHLSSS